MLLPYSVQVMEDIGRLLHCWSKMAEMELKEVTTFLCKDPKATLTHLRTFWLFARSRDALHLAHFSTLGGQATYTLIEKLVSLPGLAQPLA